MTEPCETLIEQMLRLLVRNPNQLEVTFYKGTASSTVGVKPFADDITLLIGKKGATVKSIRIILSAMSLKAGWIYTLGQIERPEHSSKDFPMMEQSWEPKHSRLFLTSLIAACCDGSVSLLGDTLEVIADVPNKYVFTKEGDMLEFEWAIRTIMCAICAMRQCRFNMVFIRRDAETQPENKGRFCAAVDASLKHTMETET